MKYYWMGLHVHENSALIEQLSHDMIDFSSGHSLPADIDEPIKVGLDEDFPDGELPTFFLDPAFIATRSFAGELINLGIDNIEIKPVEIHDGTRNTVNQDYVLLNVLGRIACANLELSDHQTIGPSMHVIDRLVIYAEKVAGLDFFLVHEDTNCLVISERIYARLKTLELQDIYFEELEQV